MGRLILQRLLWAIPLLFVVSFSVFLLVDLAPGDPAARIAGTGATEERIEQVRDDLGLDDPVLERYGRWLGDVLHGDLGTSLATGEPVTTMISRRLGPTLSLVAVALPLAIVIGGLLAVLASIKVGGVADRIVSVASSLAIAVPSFWLAIILISAFALDRTWLPALGYQPLSSGFTEWLRYLILPAITLAALPGAETTLQLKAALGDTQQEPYMLAAEAKGLSWRQVHLKHALKNALGAVVTVLGFRLAQLIGGSVVIEYVFNMKGMGDLALVSVIGGDIPVLLGLVMFTTVLVLFINLLVDMSHGYFNPKVRA